MKPLILSFVLAASLQFANAQLAAPDVVQTKMGALTIQPVQHASIIFTVNGVTIYADPSGDYILVYPDQLRDREIVFEIYDMRGRLVMDLNKMKINNDQPVKINVSQLSRGIYILTAKRASAIISRKFLK